MRMEAESVCSMVFDSDTRCLPDCETDRLIEKQPVVRTTAALTTDNGQIEPRGGKKSPVVEEIDYFSFPIIPLDALI